MQILSLKKVYSNILTEAQLDQTNFLAQLFPIAKKNPLSKGEENTAIYELIKSIEDTGLIDIKGKLALAGKENKKARNAANLKIHKDLQDLKGINGEPINLKKMRPLYGSIIDYLKGKKEVSINDCLMSADFYMKEFYDDADPEEKQLINDGKFEFSKVFKRTNFYRRFTDFKKEMGFFEDSAIKIFEDEKVKVVYPSNSDSFNTYIASSGCDVEWCTQSPPTWDSYNKRMFVMIMVDKKAREIISLKVGHDGSVWHDETCDVNNHHMDERSVRRLLSDEGHDVIHNQVVNLDLINTTASIEFSFEDFEKQILGLLDINNEAEIKNLFIRISSSDTGLFEDLSNSLIKNSINTDKVDLGLNIYVDLISDLVFNNQNWERSQQWVYALQENNLLDRFANNIIEKASNKRNHVKYFIAFNYLFMYGNEVVISRINNIEEKIKKSAFTALNKNNIINFKKILKSITSNRFTNNTLQNNFVELFKTRGFKNYLKEKRGNVLSLSDEDKFLTISILNNKKEFRLSLEEEIEKENISVEYDELDFELLIKFIKEKNNHGFYDVKKMGITKLLPYMLNFSEKDLKEIEETIYKDLVLVEFLCDKNSSMRNILLEHFFSTVDNMESLKNKNESITFDENNYKVFAYLFNTQKAGNPNYTSSRNSFRRVFAYVTEILELASKFGKSLSSVDSKIRETLKHYTSGNAFYHSLFEYDHLKSMPQEDMLNDYLELIKESKIKNDSLYAIRDYILNKNLFSQKDENTFREKLIKKMFSIQEVKSFFIDSLDSEKINIGDVYCIFYAIINRLINPTGEQFDKLIVSYINNITGYKINRAKDSHTIRGAKIPSYLSDIVFKQINKLIVSAMIVDHNATKTLGRFITVFWFNSSNYPFRELSIQLIKRCQKEGIPFSKEDISIIISSPRFRNLPEPVRHTFLNNFISIGSDGTQNILGMRDRAVVRDAMRKGIVTGNHLKKDESFILKLCKELDHYSQFQMSTVFTREKELRKSPGSSNEELLRNYLRLILN